MHKAVCSGEYLNKCAEIHNLPDLAEVNLSNLRLLCQFLDYGNCLPRCLIISRGDVHLSGIIYINLYAGLFYNALDVLAAGPYDILYLLLPYIDGDYPRRMHGKLAPRRRYGLLHLFKDVEPPLLCLVQRMSQYLFCHAGYLHIHLECSDTVFCAGNLKIHVAKMVFIAKYVGKHSNPFTFLYKPHRNTGNSSLCWHAD